MIKNLWILTEERPWAIDDDDGNLVFRISDLIAL